MLHRAIYGSFERFIAILIEHFAGAFPIWLAPVQVAIVTVADRQNDYARTLEERASQRRASGSSSTSAAMTMNAKIREAQLQKIPFTLVIGDKEVEQGAVAPRRYGGEDLKSMKLVGVRGAARQGGVLPRLKRRGRRRKGFSSVS